MNNRFEEFKNDLLKQEKEWVLITHRSCTDGIGVFLSCCAFAKANGIPTPRVISVEYSDKEILTYQNDPKSDIYDIKETNLLIGDFSFPKEMLIHLETLVNNIVVLDHHKTAEENLKGLDFCRFDMNKSGAMLVWEYLNGHENIPLLIQYIQDRDIWTWELPKSKEVSAYLSLLPKKIDLPKRISGEILKDKDYVINTDLWMDMLEDEDCVYNCMEKGEIILSYQEQVVNNKVKSSLKQKYVKLDGIEVPCINSTHLISEIGNKLAENNPYSVQYFFTETDIVFSLRSIGDEWDVSEISKRFGGGGHKMLLVLV